MGWEEQEKPNLLYVLAAYHSAASMLVHKSLCRYLFL